MIRVVADRTPNLGDEAVERNLGDKRVGPQSRVDIVLGNRIRPALDEHGQEIERLSGELQLMSATRDAATGGIKGQVAKRQRHQPGTGSAFGYGKAGSAQYQRWCGWTQCSEMAVRS